MDQERRKENPQQLLFFSLISLNVCSSFIQRFSEESCSGHPFFLSVSLLFSYVFFFCFQVLGSTGGIGRAVCREFVSARRWKVICGSRRPDVAAALVDELNSLVPFSAVAFAAGDASQDSFWTQLQQFLSRSDTHLRSEPQQSSSSFLHLDAVVVSTGQLEFVSAMELTSASIHAAIDVHVIPAALAIKFAALQAQRECDQEENADPPPPDSRLHSEPPPKCIVMLVGSTVTLDPEVSCLEGLMRFFFFFFSLMLAFMVFFVQGDCASYMIAKVIILALLV